MTFYNYICVLSLITSITLADRVNPKTGRMIKIRPLPANSTLNLLTVLPDGEVRVARFNPANRNWREPPFKMARQKLERPEFRIIGGRRTRPKEVPYQVAIGIFDDSLVWCGGTIYNKEWIISAAHCFFDGTDMRKKEKFYISAGIFDFKVKDRTEQTGKISHYIINDDYMPEPGYFNDISLIKLSKPLVYTDVVQPLPIGPASEVYPLIGEAVVSGWGYTEARRPNSGFQDDFYVTKLRSTTVEVFTREECIQFYSNVSNRLGNITAYPSIMCAGVVEGGRDSCQGDSGGPLRCTDSAGKKYLCGVVATGVGCGLKEIPGLYTIPSKYSEWIKKHAGEPDQPTISY